MTEVHSASHITAAQRGVDNGHGRIEPLIRELLTALGEDPDREGLVRTPHRVENALQFLTHGYSQSIEELVNGAIFAEEGSEMVIVKHIEFYSLCEHHMLPFFGKAHIGYISDGKIVGLSKIPRIVDMFARRLQVQERMTKQIAHALRDCLQPKGVACVIEAHHFCMMMRGVEKQESRTTTSCMLGEFCDDDKTRAEFLNLIR